MTLQFVSYRKNFSLAGSTPAKEAIQRPYLEFNEDTPFEYWIQNSFMYVQYMRTAAEAKHLLYPGQRPHGLLIGGAYDRIEFRHIPHPGEPLPDPVAIIQF